MVYGFPGRRALSVSGSGKRLSASAGRLGAFSRDILLLLQTAAIFAIGCVGTHSVDSAKLPAELTIPPGAKEISARERPGITAVSYQIAADFPATDFLSEI